MNRQMDGYDKVRNTINDVMKIENENEQKFQTSKKNDL